MTNLRQTLVFAGLSLAGASVITSVPACRSIAKENAETTSSSVASSPDLVIRQVYTGGGVAGATYTHDFVELFNRSHLPVSLSGKSLQYAPSEGSFAASANVLELPNVALEPGQSYLVQLGGAANGAALPTPDLAPQGAPIMLDKKSGKLAIVPTTAPLASCGFEGSPCASEAWIDFVAWGEAAQAEGAPIAELSSTTAAHRKGSGCNDSGNNLTDFEIAAPTPRNTTSAKTPCGGGDGGAGDASADGEADATSDAPMSDGATKPADAGPEPNSILLNEVVFNPPTATDAPYEYAEIICSPGASLWGYYFVAFEGDGDSSGGSPGVADVVVDLSAHHCGANGLVLIKATNGGHASASAQTTVVPTSALDTGVGAFENATTTFALVKSPNAPIVQGTDYDVSNSGALALPTGASLVDGFSVFDQATGVTDRTYAPRLELTGAVPGAAARIDGATLPLTSSAWFFGVLEGTEATSLALDVAQSSATTPIGAVFTPGAYNYADKPPKEDGGSSGSSGSSGNEPDPPSNPPPTSATKRDPPKPNPQKPAAGEISPSDEADSGGCSTTAHGGTSRVLGLVPFAVFVAISALLRRKRRA